MRNLVATGLAMTGAALAAIAGLGVIRLPGFFARIHVATKPGVLGLILVVLGAILASPSIGLTSRLVVIVIFQLMTAPVAAHMVGRAAYERRVGREALQRDDLTKVDPV